MRSERLVYLTRLGAKKPRVKEQPPAPEAAPPGGGEPSKPALRGPARRGTAAFGAADVELPEAPAAGGGPGGPPEFSELVHQQSANTVTPGGGPPAGNLLAIQKKCDYLCAQYQSQIGVEQPFEQNQASKIAKAASQCWFRRLFTSSAGSE